MFHTQKVQEKECNNSIRKKPSFYCKDAIQYSLWFSKILWEMDRTSEICIVFAIRENKREKIAIDIFWKHLWLISKERPLYTAAK